MPVFVLEFNITLKFLLKHVRSQDILKRSLLIIPCEDKKDESVFSNLSSNAVRNRVKDKTVFEGGCSIYLWSEVFDFASS